MKRHAATRRIGFAVLLLAGLCLFGMAASARPQTNIFKCQAGGDSEIILPEAIGDPLEPVNRALWAFNQGLLKGAIQPSSKVYRTIVPPEARRGVRNAGHNLLYPRNLLNNLLQQRWTGARDETYRFLLNSVVGIGGIFDVATHSGIAAAPCDFGQTFRAWGWKPNIYLMLPILGPSNERDAVGACADQAVNPITYFSPYSYIPLGVTYNNLTDTADEYIRATKSEYDPYYLLRNSSMVAREASDGDLNYEGERDAVSIETLHSVFFVMRDGKFLRRARTRKVKLETTGKKLPYNLWMQPGKAPLIFLVPGFGGHRLSGTMLALAELLYGEGFSVLTVSSVFNYEFMERASTTDLPGYAPVDVNDLHVALTQINKDVRGKYQERITSRALIGYSMGGFHTLYLAVRERTNDPALVTFERHMGIAAPVRLDRAITILDGYYQAVLEWPSAERTRKIENTFAKVALANQSGSFTPEWLASLNAIESKFLLGLAFRLPLRDMIFGSQVRTNMGVLQQPISKWRREDAYREILQYSFDDYLENFVTPYYQKREINVGEADTLERAVSLRGFETELRQNSNVRLIVNSNDPLLGEEDLKWLQRTFGSERLSVFPCGGHLGNLNDPAVQREIVGALADLLPKPLQ